MVDCAVDAGRLASADARPAPRAAATAAAATAAASRVGSSDSRWPQATAPLRSAAASKAAAAVLAVLLPSTCLLLSRAAVPLCCFATPCSTCNDLTGSSSSARPSDRPIARTELTPKK